MAFHMLALLVLFPCLFDCLTARHSSIIVKRKASPGKLYVFSPREGCVSVQSNTICPVAWKLNPYSAKVYEKRNDAVNKFVKIYEKLGASADCQKNIRSVSCSQYIPRCLANGSRLDYGNAREECEKLYSTCPTLVVASLKKKRFCESVRTGLHSSTNCVAMSRHIEGICPQPKYKMPKDFLEGYEKASLALVQLFKIIEALKHNNDAVVFTSSCVQKLKEIACSPVYCSEDEKEILIETDQEDCNNSVTKCFDEPTSQLQTTSAVKIIFNSLEVILKSNCKTYPQGSTAQTQQAPPTTNPISFAICRIASFYLLIIAYMLVLRIV